jgi:hypothetical protein
VDFVMPTAETVAEQLRALRRHVAEFIGDDRAPGARKLLARFDRMIAKYED